MKNSLLLLVLFISLCTTANSQKSHVDILNVTGVWVGVNYASQVGGGKTPSAITVTFVQQGNIITGEYTVATGVAGVGSGHMTGNNTFIMQWVNTTPSCPGSYENEYTISGNNDSEISWTFTGKDCLGYENGHRSATKNE